MKKIALFFPSFEVGGVEKVMIVLANRLKSLQYEIVVIETVVCKCRSRGFRE